MSEQEGGILESGPSYQYNREGVKKYRGGAISSDKFYSWQQEHMYKSTYNQNHSYNSNVPKSGTIPGYQGFLPSVRSESMYAKGITPLSKRSLDREKLDQNKTGLASTGFNVNRDSFIDQSKLGSSHKYGKTEIQRSHPNWFEQWTTTNRLTYQNPKSIDDPLYRETGKTVVANKHHQKTSGYSQNHSYLDGYGWNPNKVLKAANISSQYRNRFNPDQEFHRSVDVKRAPKLKAKEMNYQFNY